MRATCLIFILLLWNSTIKVHGETAKAPINLSYERFGKVWIYTPSQPTKGVVLFVSGDGGWNKGVVEMAQSICNLNMTVVGIDIVYFINHLRQSKEKCLYPAADFEELSLYVQKKLNFKQYFKPILLGYSSGATLIYAVLAQAPVNTFKGAVAMGFCPDLDLAKPFCEGHGLKYQITKPGKTIWFDRCENLGAPFIALQGTIDQVCPPASTASYLKGMKNAEIILLPKVGHGFSVQSRWMPQMKDAVIKIQAMPSFGTSVSPEPKPGVSAEHLSHLPLIYTKSYSNPELPLALIVSGDGGWTNFDQSIADKLSQRGIPSIGIDTQKYFWESKTPDLTAKDFNDALSFYAYHLQKKKIILLGYSFGADVIPFVASRLEPELKSKLNLIAMLSPDKKSDFEVTLSSMLEVGHDSKYDVLAEVGKLSFTRKLCIFGNDENVSDIINAMKIFSARIVLLGEGHHYSDNYDGIVNAIFQDLR
ncbi:MAG: AcvB/VirJ family lysyl-phosphatidylglycerol hydrolase [Bacteroidota bacterium]|nr:AcvB/VirJ family lysyl-phosphatidylglycerol hydrolase [Bacteroidota bacterium]